MIESWIFRASLAKVRIVFWCAIALTALSTPVIGGALVSPWPCGIVTYQFDPTMGNPGSPQRAIFQQAVSTWEQVAGVKFVERTSETTYVLVKHSTDPAAVESASKGYQKGYLYGNFDSSHMADLLHEFGHVLGFIHEQQRPDRDSYVFVNPALVDPKSPEADLADYAIIPPDVKTNTYDCESIMHYRTEVGYLTGLTPDCATKMGTVKHSHLTPTDVQAAVLAYGAPHSSVLTVKTISNGGLGSVILNPVGYPLTQTPSSLSQVFPQTCNVQLLAIPDASSAFEGWTGTSSNSGTFSTVQLRFDSTVTATFGAVPAPPPPASGGAWKWDPSLNGGLGGWVWVGTGPPPTDGGAEPSGCWHWDQVQLAWLRDICGGWNGPACAGSLFCITYPITGVTSNDPNDKSGALGYGPQRYLSKNDPFRYSISFENVATATAPAQRVSVTDILDRTHLDITTLVLGPITLGGKVLTPSPLPMLQTGGFQQIADLRPAINLLVRVSATLDTTTGTLVWQFNSLDPGTGLPPDDPLAGFLPAGTEGTVSFSVHATPLLASLTQIKNKATIVFDNNSPMDTPEWANTLDTTPPTSNVLALPPTVSSPSVLVKWQATDQGAGVRSHSIYLSQGDGPFVPWLINTTLSQSAFFGVPGSTYAFFDVAVDLVGNSEMIKTTGEARTTFVLPFCSTDSTSQFTITKGGFRLNNTTKRFVQTVTVKSIANVPVVGPFAFAIDALSSNATVYNPAGTTSCAPPAGSPFVILDPGTSWLPGQTLSVNLEFNNPTNAGITYVSRILAGNPNR